MRSGKEGRWKRFIRRICNPLRRSTTPSSQTSNVKLVKDTTRAQASRLDDDRDTRYTKEAGPNNVRPNWAARSRPRYRQTRSQGDTRLRSTQPTDYDAPQMHLTAQVGSRLPQKQDLPPQLRRRPLPTDRQNRRPLVDHIPPHTALKPPNSAYVRRTQTLEERLRTRQSQAPDISVWVEEGNPYAPVSGRAKRLDKKHRRPHEYVYPEDEPLANYCPEGMRVVQSDSRRHLIIRSLRSLEGLAERMGMPRAPRNFRSREEIAEDVWRAGHELSGELYTPIPLLLEVHVVDSVSIGITARIAADQRRSEVVHRTHVI
jgi:hypothetical protein